MRRNNNYRRNKQSRISNKAGYAPGTVTYTGEERNFNVVADVLTWDDEYFAEKKGFRFNISMTILATPKHAGLI
jgi:hypothetical protein